MRNLIVSPKYQNIYDDYHHSKPMESVGYFFKYKKYGFLPITVDSHLVYLVGVTASQIMMVSMNFTQTTKKSA